MKKNFLYILLLGFLACAPTLISSAALYFLYSKGILFLQLTGLQTILFFAITIFTMAFALTPTTLIAILSGYFFRWPGFGAVIFSYGLASLLGLALGKFLCKRGIYLHEEKSKTLHESFKKLEKQQLLFIFYARLSPILPFAMTNVALSNLKVTTKNYLWGSLLGMLPRTLAFFYAGRNATDIWAFVQHPSTTGFWKILPVALLVFSTLGIIGLLKPKNKI